MFELSKSSQDNMEGVDPRLIQIAYKAIMITPIDFGIPSTGGVRTAKEQNELFKAGKSKCDGYIKKSNHQRPEYSVYGKALDFYAYVGGGANWHRHDLAVIACAFLQAACEMGYKIESGVLWGWDSSHIEINESL